jgi:hypothetical protein
VAALDNKLTFHLLGKTEDDSTCIFSSGNEGWTPGYRFYIFLCHYVELLSTKIRSSCGYVTFDFYIIDWVSMYRNAFITFQVGSKVGLDGEDRRTKSGLLWAKWDELNLSFVSLYVGTPAPCHVAEWYAVPYRYKFNLALLSTSYSQTRFLGSSHGGISWRHLF